MIHTYLVFEKVPDATVTYHHPVTGRPTTEPKTAGFSSMNNLITVVKAKSEESAVRAVMAATGRIGSYAVVECTFLASTFDQMEVEDGVLVADSVPLLKAKNGEAEKAAE